ncbi:peptidase C39-like protein [Prosthecobacter fusiformis]|uniref:Peptidase C39-like protein n=1 Tax=Prosthecobacter fusiformis TaxID=48464 RepID=A0A4R7RQ68_9BACT|nr:cysteine peptidase family C39 domain-containing protein [Prosthecobacter fusiformis]TDU67229.1 peptidase C39-like protein [Prosthecobacter fusiformis]
MNPNWFGIVCTVVVFLAFFVSYVLAGRLSEGTRAVWTGLLVLLALPGASFAGYYAHLVDVPAWYYEFRSWQRIESALILIGVAGGFLASFFSAIPRILVLLIVSALVSVPFVKPFLGPLPEGSLQDQWQGDICLQSTYSTCGAASAATILRHHGITVSESALAREAYSYQGGTEVWYLARALRKRNLEATMHVTTDLPHRFQAHSLPAIVGVRFGHTGHFIAVLSRNDEQFHIGDPLRGSEVLELGELEQRYKFTGFWMEVHSSHPMR